MSQLSLTEAMSEINLVKKKIETKRQAMRGNLLKAKHVKDPYEATGGSVAHNLSELQAINDLEVRLLKLRAAISKANLANEITIGERTMPIHDWLIWKREVSAERTKFAKDIYAVTKQQLDNYAARPQVWEENGTKALVEYEALVDYTKFLKEHEEIQTTLDHLDGKLSLKNATIQVTIN